MSLMNIVLTLSRHTSNDMASLLPLPFHYVLGLYNTLIKQNEEEKKKQNEDTPAMSGFKMPTSFAYSSPAGSSTVKF